MSGSGWGRHSKTCCKTPLGNLAVSTAWQILRGPATSSTTGVWNVLCHISRAEEVMRERDIRHTRSIKTNSAVNLSRKPGLDLCCDLVQHLQGVQRTCWKLSIFLVRTLSYVYFARPITQIVFHIKCNQIYLSYYMDDSFCSILFILPIPLCGLYSIRAQNGYGSHRPCKIVLLTLVGPRGVTDLYLTWGINIEHARTAYNKTCRTEYLQSIYNHIIDLIDKHRITNGI